jgi:iron(III) transport system substrate-binding protein
MSEPGSSRAGYFHVLAWIQLSGEEEACRFTDRLYANIASYAHAGTKPCRDAAAGEFPIGISYELAGTQAKERGAPVDVHSDEGGRLGHGRRRNPQGDASAGRGAAARRVRGKPQGQPSLCDVHPAGRDRGHRQADPDYPEGVAASMIKNDLVWASENRERIIAEWKRRYGSR